MSCCIRGNGGQPSDCCLISKLKNEKDSMRVEAVLLVGAVAMLVIGALASQGVFTVMRPVQASYLSIGMIGGTALLSLAAFAKFVYVSTLSQAPLTVEEESLKQYGPLSDEQVKSLLAKEGDFVQYFEQSKLAGFHDEETVVSGEFYKAVIINEMFKDSPFLFLEKYYGSPAAKLVPLFYHIYVFLSNETLQLIDLQSSAEESLSSLQRGAEKLYTPGKLLSHSPLSENELLNLKEKITLLKDRLDNFQDGYEECCRWIDEEKFQQNPVLYMYWKCSSSYDIFYVPNLEDTVIEVLSNFVIERYDLEDSTSYQEIFSKAERDRWEKSGYAGIFRKFTPLWNNLRLFILANPT